MSRPDWKELTDDDGYEDGSFMVIGKVGPNEHIIVDELEKELLSTNVIVLEPSADTPSPAELPPEEVRKIMEAPITAPTSVSGSIAKSIISVAESLTPSFVTGENPSLTTNGSSLSNSSTEAIFDNATNQVAHLTEENQILKRELERNRELTMKNIETWRQFEITATEQHQTDKEKHEESRQLVLKLREEKDSLKARVAQLEEIKTRTVDMDLLTDSTTTICNDELKSLEAKLTVKDDSLRRLRSLLEENEALLTEEKYQTELLKKLLREQEVTNSKVVEQSPSAPDIETLKSEWAKEREQNEYTLARFQEELESSRITFNEAMHEKEIQIETLKKEIDDLHTKIENLSDYNSTLEKDSETARRVVLRIEDQLGHSQKENIFLTTKVAAMKAENEYAANLKQEMESFRLDYLTERENRSKVEDEKSSLLLQLNVAKEELQRSQEELENLHKTHLTFATEHVNRNDSFVSLPERRSLSPAPNSSPSLGKQIIGFIRHDIFGSRDEEASSVDSQVPSGSGTREENVVPPQKPEIQPCPLCGKKLENLSKLQKHAAICGLDSDNEFTDPFVFP